MTSAGRKRYLNSDGSLNRKGVETFRGEGDKLKGKINASKDFTNRNQVVKNDTKRSRNIHKEMNSLYKELYDYDDHGDWLKDNYDPKKLKRFKELDAQNIK